jgi:ABC-type transport system involved in multi-copper enzyme maturation permease subunit
MVWPGPAALAVGFGVGVLVLVMWGVLGAALGVTLRGVALPIGLGVVWVLGVENLLSAVAGSTLTALQPLRHLLSGVNAGSLISAVLPGGMIEPPPGVNSSVTDTRALITLVCYVVVCSAVAAWAWRRRDVV